MAGRRGNVPRFGQAEGNENNQPYTVMFERAAKGLPDLMPSGAPKYASSMARAKQDRKPGSGELVDLKKKPETNRGTENVVEPVIRRLSEPPARRARAPSVGRGAGGPVGGGILKPPSVDALPREGSAPDAERFVARARAASVIRSEEKGGGHVPKFGDWNNPNGDVSGPSYTVVFTKASKERQNGGLVRGGSAEPESPPNGDLYFAPKVHKFRRPGGLLCCIMPTASR